MIWEKEQLLSQWNEGIMPVVQEGGRTGLHVCKEGLPKRQV